MVLYVISALRRARGRMNPPSIPIFCGAWYHLLLLDAMVLMVALQQTQLHELDLAKVLGWTCHLLQDEFSGAWPGEKTKHQDLRYRRLQLLSDEIVPVTREACSRWQDRLWFWNVKSTPMSSSTLLTSVETFFCEPLQLLFSFSWTFFSCNCWYRWRKRRSRIQGRRIQGCDCTPCPS